MKVLPQIYGKLESGQPIREIVICKDQVGPDNPSRNQVQRGRAVRRRRRAMAFLLEKEFEELAYFGIVLDDQDRAGVAYTVRYAVGDALPITFTQRLRLAC